MGENNTLLNSIVLAGTLAGSIYLFSTGLICMNMYSHNQKNKFPMYLNLGVMGVTGIAWAHMCYKKFPWGVLK